MQWARINAHYLYVNCNIYVQKKYLFQLHSRPGIRLCLRIFLAYRGFPWAHMYRTLCECQNDSPYEIRKCQIRAKNSNNIQFGLGDIQNPVETPKKDGEKSW